MRDPPAVWIQDGWWAVHPGYPVTATIVEPIGAEPSE